MSPAPATSLKQHLQTRWILNSWLDVAFFVGTPLLIIPIVFTAGRQWSGEDIFLIVSTFGALGHHAPGLMRAYGDKQLFRRFWLRFTVVPIIAVVVFTHYRVEELPGMMLVLLSWGIWHFQMQTYGFARIYDSKVRCFDATTRRLDFAVCLFWSGACLLSAPNRIREFLALALNSGLTFVRDVPIDQIRSVWLAVTAVVTLLFLANIVRKVVRGESVNVAKLILLLTTYLFFWMCSVTITNFLLGIAMFELFHDVQYLAIVWLFNRNRVEKEPDVGAFTRFVFRRSGGLMGIYVGLVVAYGFVGFAAERLTSATLQQALFGVVAASNLLHFYYDGFIWKIREPETSRALGVTATASSGLALPRGLGHAAKWGVLLAVVGLLQVAERSSDLDPLEQARVVADRIPQSVAAQNSVAKELIDRGQFVEAIRVCRLAEQLHQPQYRTHMYLGVALTAIGQPNSGFAELRRAMELNPHDAYLRFHLAMAYIRQDQPQEALVHLRTSVAIRPNDAIGQYNVGALLLMLRSTEEAIASLHKAIEIRPDYAEAHRSLGEAYLLQGSADLAIQHLQTSLQLDPDQSGLQKTLADALLQSGQRQAATEILMTAARRQLRMATTDTEFASVAKLADLLLQNTQHQDPDAMEVAARCYAAAGRFDTALQVATAGAALAGERQNQQLQDVLQRQIQEYSGQTEGRIP